MKKVRQPKSAHRKTQTPIVAKQISSSGKDVSSHNNLPGPALLPNPQRYCARKKAYLSLRGKHILQLLMKFVWHPNYTTHSFLLQENSEKMLRKSLFCRKTHGGMQSRPARIRRTNRLLAAILLADCRANAPRRANRPDCRAKKAPVGKARRPAAVPVLRGRQKWRGKAFSLSVWSAMFRLSFVSSVYRHTGRDAGAGHSGIRRNLWIIRSGQ
ncbi:MAG: hypothetical protein ACLUFV_08595 [Acutalibacteraceae bacterium]